MSTVEYVVLLCLVGIVGSSAWSVFGEHVRDRVATADAVLAGLDAEMPGRIGVVSSTGLPALGGGGGTGSSTAASRGSGGSPVGVVREGDGATGSGDDGSGSAGGATGFLGGLWRGVTGEVSDTWDGIAGVVSDPIGTARAIGAAAVEAASDPAGTAQALYEAGRDAVVETWDACAGADSSASGCGEALGSVAVAAGARAIPGGAVVTTATKVAKATRRGPTPPRRRGDRDDEEEERCVGDHCARDNECFVAGTLVHTASGLRPIESIQPGERVWSRGEDGEQSLEAVVQTFVTPDQKLWRVSVVDARGRADSFEVTSEHPYRTVSGRWVGASDLKTGQAIVAFDGAELRVTRVASLGRRATVYNFEVANRHTYFVGESRAWVHNQCDGEGRGAGSRPSDRFSGRDERFEGTDIPKGGRLELGDGEEVFVTANALEHIAEVGRRASNPANARIARQAELDGLLGAVDDAAGRGIRYGEPVRSNGWELVFGEPRAPGDLPSVIHANPDRWAN